MSRKKRIIWLCLLAVVVVAAAWQLWPRSMESLIGAEMEEVTAWKVEAEYPHPAADAPDQYRGQGPQLQALYGWRFSSPKYSPALISTARWEYEVSFLLEGKQKGTFVHITSDGTLWDGIWRYRLVGGEEELERLNHWLEATVAETNVL